MITCQQWAACQAACYLANSTIQNCIPLQNQLLGVVSLVAQT
jgi:hypothetical protein